jgi:chromosome segregation ATPase
LNGRIQEKNQLIMVLEAAIQSEKQANSGLTAQYGEMCRCLDATTRELASSNVRLRKLDQEYNQSRHHSIELELENKQLRDREKRLRAQLSAFSYSKDEEKMALSKKDAPKEELIAIITSLKRQNADLTLQVRKLEQDVMMQEERSGSVAQLLSSIDRGARFEADVGSIAGSGSKVRKRARIQSAVEAYVKDSTTASLVCDQDVKDGFSALKLAKQ